MKVTFLIIGSILIAFGCKKAKTNTRYSEKGIGRIIGYDPCGYYTNPNKVNGAGFVIEIDKGILKDTVLTYQIPDGLFEFPVIDYWSTVYGNFLFPSELQSRYRIKFNYKTATENEKMGYACLAIVNAGPIYAATKGNQILVFDIAKY